MLSGAIRLYRKTLKHVPMVHRAAYGMGTRLAIPTLEQVRKFRTLSTDPMWFRMALLTGSYEPQTVQVVQEIVTPGMTAIDIGAHVGYFTVLLAKLVGERGNVFAFEPHPDNRRVLLENTSRFRTVTVEPFAVSDRDGEAMLFNCTPDSGGSSLACDEAWLEKAEPLSDLDREVRGLGTPEVRKYNVKQVTLDSYFKGQMPDDAVFVKMDVEGAECAALRGMKSTLDLVDRLWILMEVCPRTLQAFGASVEQLVEMIRVLRLVSLLAIDRIAERVPPAIKPADLERVATRGEFGRINLLCRRG